MRLLFRLLWQHAQRHPVLALLLALSTSATAALWVIEPLYSSSAIDRMLTIAEGNDVNLWAICGVWAGLFVALSLSQAFQKYLQWRFDMLLELERIEMSYEHVLGLPLDFHNRQKAGESMKTIENGANDLAYTLSRSLLDFVPSIAAAVAFLIISIFIEWRLAVLLFAVLTIFSAMTILGSMRMAKRQDEVNRMWVRPGGRAFDAIMNVSSVKSGGQEEREIGILKKMHVEALAKQLYINVRWAVLEGLHFFMFTRIVIVIVGILLLIRGELTLGELYFFQFSFYRVLTPFEMLSGMLPQWSKSISKVKLSEELLSIPQEPGHRARGTRIQNLQGEITFDDVSFSYHPAPVGSTALPTDTAHQPPETQPDEQHEDRVYDPVPAENTPAQNDGAATPEVSPEWKATIEHLSLSVRPSEHIALVGHSGAGKSTIAMLLNRFYDVTHGRILIDGVDLRELDLQWWRSQIGLVLQENLMFNDSVLENIRYARPSATREEVIEAAQRASAHDFISRLPQGYDTEVGERGVKLSGGERQRLAIARAILKKPAIVILDEATSALDSITERHVQEGIKELIKGRTSFIIAHRLSTVRSVDRIAVMEQGKVTAFAPHEELMKTSPTYKQMVELQREGMLAE